MSEERGPTKILEQILRVQKWMAWATVALYFALTAFGGLAWAIRSHDVARIDSIATTNQAALCAFRHDVQNRIEAQEQFLQEHPNGIPGISPAAIKVSIRTQRQTVDALGVLNCEEG